jgi:hypothetical protein
MTAAYFVCTDLARLRNARLSRPIVTTGTLRRVLKRIRRHTPDAFAVSVERFR